MRVREALALGAIQGLSEFLPVSSSAHLALARRALGHGELPRAFDVGLHLGTTAALALVTGPTWARAAREAAALIRGRAPRDGVTEGQPGVLRPILVATVPAVVVGAALYRRIEVAAREPRLVALGLVAGTMAMAGLAVGRGGRPSSADAAPISNAQALGVGVAQAVALLPGLSRSGMTLATGEALGLEREAALRFSLLLAVPVTVGAAVRSAGELRRVGEQAGEGAALAGVAASFVAGLAGLALLRGLMRRGGAWPFLPYRLLLAVVVWRWSGRGPSRPPSPDRQPRRSGARPRGR